MSALIVSKIKLHNEIVTVLKKELPFIRLDFANFLLRLFPIFMFVTAVTSIYRIYKLFKALHPVCKLDVVFFTKPFTISIEAFNALKIAI